MWDASRANFANDRRRPTAHASAPHNSRATGGDGTEGAPDSTQLSGFPTDRGTDERRAAPQTPACATARAMFKFGDWYLPDGEAHMVEYLRAQPAYQGVHRATALEYVRRFGTAVDVGAHVGLWSRDLAARFATVHAFEPVDAH